LGASFPDEMAEMRLEIELITCPVLQGDAPTGLTSQDPPPTISLAKRNPVPSMRPSPLASSQSIELEITLQ